VKKKYENRFTFAKENVKTKVTHFIGHFIVA